MQNAGLDEAQAGIKISGRNINNLRYADNIILMMSAHDILMMSSICFFAESKEELKSLLMKVNRRVKKLAKTQHLKS